MTPTQGRIVLYKLSSDDASDINRRRADFTAYCNTNPRGESGIPGASGHIGHYGNTVLAGDIYPAMIVQTWGQMTVNLQVHLDGNDTYWATSRQEGSKPGQWMVPPRMPDPVFGSVTPEQMTEAAINIK